MERLKFNVAGVTMDNRQAVLSNLMAESRIHPAILKREPDNPNDPNAVAVLVKGQKIGYVPRESAEDIGELVSLAFKTTVEIHYSQDIRKYWAECKMLLSIKMEA